MIFMIKNRMIVLIDTIFNSLVLLTIQFINNIYLKKNWDIYAYDYPSSKKIFIAYLLINLGIVIFLLFLSVIVNYIQYRKVKLNAQSYTPHYLYINILISVLPFLIPAIY